SSAGAAPRGNGSALAGVVPINVTVPCDSGALTISGTLSDAGLGTIAVTFASCRLGSNTMSGPASMRIDALDLANLVITDGTPTFTRNTLTGPGLNLDFSGSLQVQESIASNTETVTENLTLLDNTTLTTGKAENVVF